MDKIVENNKTKRAGNYKPWNKGKRKPVIDDAGLAWCNCVNPNLSKTTHRGQAFCLLCNTPWYH